MKPAIACGASYSAVRTSHILVLLFYTDTENIHPNNPPLSIAQQMDSLHKTMLRSLRNKHRGENATMQLWVSSKENISSVLVKWHSTDVAPPYPSLRLSYSHLRTLFFSVLSPSSTMILRFHLQHFIVKVYRCGKTSGKN